MNQLIVTSRDPAIVAQVRIRCSNDPWAAERLAMARGHFITAVRIALNPEESQQRAIALTFLDETYPDQHSRATLCVDFALHHAKTIALRGECWYVDFRNMVRFARLDFPDMHSTPYRPLFMLTL